MPTSSRFHYRIIRPLFPGNNIIFTQFAYHCQALDSPHALPPPPSSLSFFISLPPRPTIIRPTITLLTRSIVSRNHQLVPRSYSYLLSLSLSLEGSFNTAFPRSWYVSGQGRHPATILSVKMKARLTGG